MPSQEESMQQLLMDNILPMAQRRIPASILSTMKDPNIELLLKYYESSLMSMFKHFAAASDQLTKDRNMVRATRHAVQTFDDQIEQIQKANARCQQQNSVAKQMSYSDFMHFTADLGLVSRYLLLPLLVSPFQYCRVEKLVISLWSFELNSHHDHTIELELFTQHLRHIYIFYVFIPHKTNSLPITIVEFGDIYLTVISFSNFSTSLRRIDFAEFCEVPLRIFIYFHYIFEAFYVLHIVLLMG